jgi:hypothetical protein
VLLLVSASLVIFHVSIAIRATANRLSSFRLLWHGVFLLDVKRRVHAIGLGPCHSAAALFATRLMHKASAHREPDAKEVYNKALAQKHAVKVGIDGCHGHEQTSAEKSSVL